MSLESQILEALRDIKLKNPGPGDSREPFRDALRIHIQSMEDTVKDLKKYCASTPQDKMTIKSIEKYLSDINRSCHSIRELMKPSQYSYKLKR